ncbi:MAG: hypothetical protein FGM57_01115 [Candidatus Taylorbacteria bacterium]|nr:hypothetical protein [Candidatus Taylorbacteria bacterium]
MNSATLLHIALSVLSVILSIFVDSLIEWWVHKYPMHRKLPGPFFKFLFRHHVTIHHAKFSGEAYHHHNHKDRETIAFPLWVGPLLILTAISPFWAFSYYIGNNIPVYSSLAVAILYYVCFEGFHQLMHMEDYPVVRWIRKSKWFTWLDTHHEIHHLKAGVNFNLVCPLGDYAMGTLLTASEYALKFKK